MNRSTRTPQRGLALSRRRRVVLWTSAGIAVVVLALGAFDYLRINLWIDRDAGRFDRYPYVLVQNKQPVLPPHGAGEEKINRMVIEEMNRRGRNVVTLARSEIKHNLLRTRAYTKVFLETADPDKPDLRSRLVVLCEFRRASAGWQLTDTFEKTLE
jgi:hypothetical protein